jgi:tetratricopeptide (TPR) repeat protein
MGIFNARLCWLFAALTVAGPVAATAGEDKTLLRAREGAAALMGGQYDKAIGFYDEALSSPDIADFIEASIYSDRGVAKWRMKRTSDAIDDFNKSIQLSPENATVYNNRGNAIMDLGHPEEAVKDFDRAIALQANYGAAFNNRGNAHAALGQYDAAFEDFRKAVELMPQSAVPFNGRGKMQAELKRYHAAVRDFTRAISLDAKYTAAYVNRAQANFAVDNFQETEDDVTQALALMPDQPSPDLLLLRGRAYAGDKKFNQALDDFNKTIELQAERVDAYVERGVAFTDMRRFDDAIGDLTRAIELDPKNARAYAMRAEAKLQAENPDEALGDVNESLELTLDDPMALRIRGNIYEALTRTDDAILDYQKALAKDPFQTESREALVRLDQPVPEEAGVALGEPVSGWVVTQPSPGRYLASNPKYASLRVELEMFGSGSPKILEWKLMRDALTGIGLLKYYAGNFGDGAALEYVAIIDTRANKVVSIEPQSWGDKTAQWNWQAVSVVVTDPDGNANEVTLRRGARSKPVVADRDTFWGFGQSSNDAPPVERRRGRRGVGGGGTPGAPGILNWLFR